MEEDTSGTAGKQGEMQTSKNGVKKSKRKGRGKLLFKGSSYREENSSSGYKGRKGYPLPQH